MDPELLKVSSRESRLIYRQTVAVVVKPAILVRMQLGQVKFYGAKYSFLYISLVDQPIWLSTGQWRVLY